jgi:hypothetical protein
MARKRPSFFAQKELFPCFSLAFRSRSHNAVIRVYDDAGNVIETHEHAGDFREP